MAKNIMIQGTASSVGKSIIAAALCRIFVQDGYKVAPFKSQNMALNSFVTKEGLEMGRAQAVQAEACKIDPSVLMNPILLKPFNDERSQVIINGKIFKNMRSGEYHEYKPELKELITEAYCKLSRKYDIIVIEGAGSPAEINLNQNDIVNMGMAEIADAPVILVADIERGGVFASIVGTAVLLAEEERNRIKGIIINKFRGDPDLFHPGIKQIEDLTQIPVIGVIPYMDINLADEDSVTEKLARKSRGGRIVIDVVRLPYISNFTDFDVFDMYDDVDLNYVESPEEMRNPDIIILPGSKNTIEDLEYIRKTGIERRILELHKNGTPVIGICGGYQMLGSYIEDPSGIEGRIRTIDGMKVFNAGTTLLKDKTTKQVTGVIAADSGLLKGLKGSNISGYEIHTGISDGNVSSMLAVTEHGAEGISVNNAIGTYIHGIFDNVEFTDGILNNIRKKKGLPYFENKKTYADIKEENFNKLAETFRQSVSMKRIYSMLNKNNVACC